MHLTVLDFTVIVAYFAGLTTIGFVFSKQQTSEESYFLGNRRLPWPVVGMSVMATIISSLTYLSLPGEMIKYGVGYFFVIFAILGAVPVITRIIIPALMRLPVTSVYEHFENRYDLSVRFLGAVVFILMRLTWIGLVIYTTSFAVSQMTGWDSRLVILIIGVITTIYTTAGGMPAVVWSDFIQGVLLLGGALFIPIFVAFRTQTGPVAWWNLFSLAGRTEVPIFNLDLTVRLTVVGIMVNDFVWNICTHGADQVAAQRYLSTTTADSARRSVWVFAWAVVLLFVLLALVGLSLFYFYYHDTGVSVDKFAAQIADEADKVFPRFVARELPSGVSGLLMAAILAAAMSSLSSGINSISATVTSDFVGRFGQSGERERKVTKARGISVAAGLLGISMALLVYSIMQSTDWSLVEMINRINHLFLAPLGALFLGGVLFRRVGVKAAWLGFLAGVLASFLISFSKEVFHMQEGISFTWILAGSLLVSMGVSYLAGFLFAPPSKKQIDSFTVRPSVPASDE